MRRCALVLALLLLVSVASTGFAPAAESSDVNIAGMVTAEGHLAMGEYDTYGPFQVTECIIVDLGWVPGCSTVSVELIRCDAFIGERIFLTGGSGRAVFCPVPSWCYYVVIKNWGPCSIHYFGPIEYR